MGMKDEDKWIEKFVKKFDWVYWYNIFKNL